jgi:predicted RNA methylase
MTAGALTLPGVETLPPQSLRQVALSQWFTPERLAARLVRWACVRPHMHVLEPSAGDGAIEKAIRLSCDTAFITAIEIDPAFANKHGFICEDYLAAPAPITRYDLAILNPPYEDGADGKFLAKAMDESERVVALCRLNVVTGKARHERVWSRVDDGSWTLSGLAFLVGRPSFLAAGLATDSPLSDFVAIKLRRTSPGIPAKATHVEWWT